jgi:hypothetical protein
MVRMMTKPKERIHEWTRMYPNNYEKKHVVAPMHGIRGLSFTAA